MEPPPWESPQWQELVRRNRIFAPFFDKLESFVELLEGIQKLRHLTMTLGVTGRLVEATVIRLGVDLDRLVPRYAVFAVEADNARQQIEAFCATTAENIGISATNLKSDRILVPPIAKQKRVVSKVSGLMSQIEEYLYFKKGYIYPEVWYAWCRGIKYWIDVPKINDIWEQEMSQESSYGLTTEIIRRDAKK